MVPETVLKEGRCPVGNNQQAFTTVVYLLLLFALFIFLDLNIVFSGQVTDRFRIGILFVLHNEVDRMAAFAAAEAFVDSLAYRNVKGGCFFIMEGAQPQETASAFFQVHKIAYYLFNLNGIKNTIDGTLLNH